MIFYVLNDISDPVGQTNYQVVLAITYLLIVVGKASDMKSTIIASFERAVLKDWSNCLDRRQVWNQKRPPWFEAMHHLIYPLLTPIANILISSMQTGATIYQVRYIYLLLHFTFSIRSKCSFTFSSF